MQFLLHNLSLLHYPLTAVFDPEYQRWSLLEGVGGGGGVQDARTTVKFSIFPNF